MDYSRVSLTDPAGRVLVALQGVIVSEQARIWAMRDKALADPSKTRAEKQLVTHQCDAAYDALMWAFDQASNYFTPVGGDGS